MITNQLYGEESEEMNISKNVFKNSDIRVGIIKCL